MCDECTVNMAGRVFADVAVAAVFGFVFVEVGEQDASAAAYGFCELHHAIQLIGLDFCEFAVFNLGNDLSPNADVCIAVEEQGVCGQSVASGAADFLVVAFDVFGHVVMDDPADVGFVNPHAKGHGSTDDGYFVFEEGFLDFAAVFGIHACVVVLGFDAALAQFAGELLGAFLAEAIDDARFVGAVFDEGDDLRDALLAGPRFEVDVGPVKGGDEFGGLMQAEQLGDVAARYAVGCSRQGDDGNAREFFFDALQRFVIGPEVVSPGGDAVRFVYGEEVDLCAVKKAKAIGSTDFFGRDIEQVELAIEKVVFHASLLGVLQGAVEVSRFDAGRAQGIHLVFHQGDEGRDDDGRSRQSDGGNLVAKRLPAAGGHDHEAVAPFVDGRDDLLLEGPECVVAKVLF